MAKVDTTVENFNIEGFSKMNKKEKLDWLANTYLKSHPEAIEVLEKYRLTAIQDQLIFDRISENPISNFILPFGIAPNFVINGEDYAIPMVIEESSVVAAAAGSAKFWMNRGGFTAEVKSTIKLGQIHFYWSGNIETLLSHKNQLFQEILTLSKPITENMDRRGGGIINLDIKDFPEEKGYYQFLLHFETCNSMGANFINSILENIAQNLHEIMGKVLQSHVEEPEIVMSILSNYTPECIAKVEVCCPIKDLKHKKMSGEEFAQKFQRAIRIAEIDPYRATTHNKGIMNGVDAVVIATGNDFRAIEASAHAYAARSGQYRSLSYCHIDQAIFTFGLELPLALGTVGGLTSIHPLAGVSLDLLNQPNAKTLMKIIATAGLAQNFAAIKSLITTGIQKGHMKMHLLNILNHIKSTNEETKKAVSYFSDKVVSYSAVRQFILNLRKQ